MSTELLRSLAQAGLRIFDKDDLVRVALSLGLKETYVPKMTSLMIKNGDLVSLSKGLYALPVELLAGGPLHSFEIAMKLAKGLSVIAQPCSIMNSQIKFFQKCM
jgi:hypothetical protein